MKDIESWIDGILEKPLPDETVAVAFNLYECNLNQWSIELVGCGSFDAEDSDWACNELFDARDSSLLWIQDASWEEILDDAIDSIKKYIETGKYSERLKACKGVGFVDGDLTIVYQA